MKLFSVEDCKKMDWPNSCLRVLEREFGGLVYQALDCSKYIEEGDFYPYLHVQDAYAAIHCGGTVIKVIAVTCRRVRMSNSIEMLNDCEYVTNNGYLHIHYVLEGSLLVTLQTRLLVSPMNTIQHGIYTQEQAYTVAKEAYLRSLEGYISC